MPSRYTYDVDAAGNTVISAKDIFGKIPVRAGLTPSGKLVVDVVELIMSRTGKSRDGARIVWHRDLKESRKKMILSDLEAPEGTYNALSSFNMNLNSYFTLLKSNGQLVRGILIKP
jgi:hypothetical protein